MRLTAKHLAFILLSALLGLAMGLSAFSALYESQPAPENRTRVQKVEGEISVRF